MKRTSCCYRFENPRKTNAKRGGSQETPLRTCTSNSREQHQVLRKDEDQKRESYLWTHTNPPPQLFHVSRDRIPKDAGVSRGRRAKTRQTMDGGRFSSTYTRRWETQRSYQQGKKKKICKQQRPSKSETQQETSIHNFTIVTQQSQDFSTMHC